MPDQHRIAIYSIADLKHTTDDALPAYLSSLKFRQSHRLTDVRLALGYTAVAVAAILFGLDYQFGWHATKAYTGPAVGIYFALNSAFMYWMYFVEKGMIYSGTKDGNKLEVASRVDKNMPIYHLTVRFASPVKKNAKSNLLQEIRISAPFTQWFTSDGYFVAKPFQQFVASEIPLVGEADPNSVVEEIGRGSGLPSANEIRVDGNVQDVLHQLKAAGAKARRRK